MAGNVFITSDSHFGHANMLRFKREDGTPVRDFASVEEMDETMVANWNAIVRPGDRVYHLGDIAMAKSQIATLGRCNGKKHLIKGNHDIFTLKDYLPFVYNISSFKKMDGAALSHFPIHPGSLGRFGLNLHGHTHHQCLDDDRYVNMCVEMTNYTPVPWDDVQRVIRNRR